MKVGDKVRIKNITCPTVDQYHTDGDECRIVRVLGVNEYDAEFDTGRCWLIGEGVCDVELVEEVTADNNGGSTDYYKLPANVSDLQDLIEAKNMNFAMGNIFKSVYRMNESHHSNKIRDLNKIVWFAQREINRLQAEVKDVV